MAEPAHNEVVGTHVNDKGTFDMVWNADVRAFGFWIGNEFNVVGYITSEERDAVEGIVR